MKIIALLKNFLILVLPLILLLLAAKFLAFDDNFYNEKFKQYSIDKEIPKANFLHNKVVSFLKSESTELPDDFNEKEKQHLLDVRKVVSFLTISLYVLIFLFILLLGASVIMLKITNLIMNFIGKVLFFGGVLTIILAMILFFFINYDFAGTFESLHLIFFQKGSYTFDPAKEIIVKLYPEKLFMDLGVRIAQWISISSVAIMILGTILVFQSKNKKNKKKVK